MTDDGRDRLGALLDAVLDGTDSLAGGEHRGLGDMAPESFVMSSVFAHVLTYAAHRRQLVRRMLTALGHEPDHGDPIMWLRAQRGETP